MKHDKLLFAVLGGSYRGKVCGVIMQSSALPLAALRYTIAPSGFHDLWANKMDVEEFFEALSLDHLPDRGLWVIETEYDETLPESDVIDEDDWSYLIENICVPRRLQAEELSRMKDGKPPWRDSCWL